MQEKVISRKHYLNYKAQSCILQTSIKNGGPTAKEAQFRALPSQYALQKQMSYN